MVTTSEQSSPLRPRQISYNNSLSFDMRSRSSRINHLAKFEIGALAIDLIVLAHDLVPVFNA